MNNDKNEKGLINQQEVEDLYAGIRNILANMPDSGHIVL